MRLALELSPRSLREAAKQIRSYSDELQDKVELFVERLGREGLDVAQAEVRRDTGMLGEAIHLEWRGDTTLALVSGGEYAAFVEFGTGVVGKRSPHPGASEHGWDYDVHNHGDEGWWYIDRAGDARWTKGQSANGYMAQAGATMHQLVADVAKEVFG